MKYILPHILGLARSREKAAEALTRLGVAGTPIACELADPASVRAAVAAVRDLGRPLDVVMANAGIMALPTLAHAHGYELQFFTNHVGHFLLVTSLVDRLAERGRVVVLSSAGHQFAPADGIVTNLRLASGQYVSPGQPLLSFLDTGPRWIRADMRENQLGNIAAGQDVLISLDVKPGKLFHGKVHSVGWGATQGNEAPTGQLPSVQPTQGWVREPQRFPVRIMLLPEEREKASFDAGRSGAQANVVVFTDDGFILNPVSRLWLKMIALFSYLQ